ncbi:hypothetical protein [Shewanella aestuarii]|uniref:hypothetical protein n=1 Tax=Shewanella aestuarii TaxID=1028752 RepID=UPI001FCBF70E|nr:hypothetical protein [Shewanella aestuarii]
MSNKVLNRIAISLAVGFFGFIIWIIYLANTGGRSVFFVLIKHMPYGDKVGHMLLFGTLTIWLTLHCNFVVLTLANMAFIGAASEFRCL